MLFGLRVFYDISNAIVFFICSRNTATDWSIANLFY